MLSFEPGARETDAAGSSTTRHSIARVIISGQKRVTSGIRRQLRRRSAVEPVIGHHDLWFSQGDASNTILAAAGYNFRCLIWWLRLLLRQIFFALTAALERVPV
jgi:IS5 family transposase